MFNGFFLGGFECSCHRLADGRRLDLTAATQHDVFADADYARLRALGMRAARDGVQWCKVDKGDFSSLRPLLDAALRHDVTVIWDLMHFGWPDDIDIFGSAFVPRFAQYARSVARFVGEHTDRLFFTPINEMSFLAWAAGDVRCMYPFEAARGVELKVQLVRATIAAIDAVRSVAPHARFVQPEPLIHIVANPKHPKTHSRVESDNLLQYQAWDMLTGRVWPSLGGDPRYLDIVGVNFYSDNQFTPEGDTIAQGDARYKPFSRMLLDVSARYQRPILIAETGAEGEARVPWLRYVCEQVDIAMQEGCAVEGITLYPVVNHPGWVDGRHCHNGLWDYADDRGDRPIHQPLAEELALQTRVLAEASRPRC